ncbi:MAG: hypothetical protein V4819_19220 [Verrucomicrobiota bacterium]
MRRNLFNPLFTKHEDTPPASSGSSAPATAPETGTGEETKEEKKDDESEPEPEPEKEPEAPAAAAKPNAFQRGALRALGIGDLVARVERAEAAEAVANAEVTRLTAENIRLTGELTKLEKETPQKIEAAAKGRDNEVSKQVTAELTALGVSADAAPSQVAADQTPEAMLEHFATLKGAEKTAYWRANSKALKIAEASAVKSK